MTKLAQAEGLIYPIPVPQLRPIAAWRAEIWIRQGNLEAAREWAQSRELSVEDELAYRHEYEYATLARLFIAQYQLDGQKSAIQQALLLLRRLLDEAEAARRAASIVALSVLRALALRAHGHSPGARKALERALAIAEPQGFIQVFLSEGTPIADLIQDSQVQDLWPDYTRKLLAAFRNPDPTPTFPHLPNVPVGEALSERELEVLSLVAEGFSNREISERLFVALNTVKGHNSKIFAKLDVNRRTEAVARARSLGLIP